MNKITLQRILKNTPPRQTTCYSWWEDGTVTIQHSRIQDDGMVSMGMPIETNQRPNPDMVR